VRCITCSRTVKMLTAKCEFEQMCLRLRGATSRIDSGKTLHTTSAATLRRTAGAVKHKRTVQRCHCASWTTQPLLRYTLSTALDEDDRRLTAADRRTYRTARASHGFARMIASILNFLIAFLTRRRTPPLLCIRSAWSWDWRRRYDTPADDAPVQLIKLAYGKQASRRPDGRERGTRLVGVRPIIRR